MVKRIQVLLATYNGAKWLDTQLNSLAAQDDGCFSVLMSDDGSTDDTLTLLKERCAMDPRFTLLPEGARQKGEGGAAGHFITLMRHSDAPYAALCDQDDQWLPQRLSACRKAMEDAEARYGANTPLLVHSDATVITADGHTLRESFFAHQGWDPSAVTLERLLAQNNVTGCTILMNAPLRRLVLKHADLKAMYMHDWFIALTAAAFGHVVFVDQPLVLYRQHGTNVMGASQDTQVKRGLRMLGRYRKGKARIRLTYTHTRAFRSASADDLPPRSLAIIDRYLQTERMPKPLRVWRVMRGGYTMQSRVTRLGQVFFG